jgi:hypothetical protein
VTGDTDPGDPSSSRGADVRIPHPSAEQLLGPDADPTSILPPADWDDSVDPGPGDDVVVGSPGDDAVEPSPGNDTVAGGDGADRLGGGDGADALDGGPGQDVVGGDGGDDEADGGADRDVVDGGPGTDGVRGGDGGDTLRGGPDDGSDGGDTLDGGTSVDDLSGGGGNDTLRAGEDADAAFGESGDDTIETAAGFDSAYGGDGADTCVDSEQAFLCEERRGVTDNVLPLDAPEPAGPCSAFAAAGGDDQAPGTFARPFRTAERLANSLRPGQVGCLVGGDVPFEEPDHEIHVRAAGEPGSPITLRSAPAGPRATVKGRLWIDGAAHDVVIEGLILDGRNPLALLRGVGAALPSPTINGDRITFFGNDVSNLQSATCFIVGSVHGFGVAEDVTLAGNRIHDCGVTPSPASAGGDQGMNLEASRNAVVEDNYVFDNAGYGILVYPDAQGSFIRDNVLDRNRINLHYGTASAAAGWIYPEGTEVLPQNNPATNNVITNARLDQDDPSHWQVEGFTGPRSEPAGNLVDLNCFWHQNPARNIQRPNHGFTEGPSNTIAASGPGYANEAAKDFSLLGGPGQCARSFGPEDPPFVETLAPEGGVAGFRITDRSRTAGSVVRIEFRSDTAVRLSAPVNVAPGAVESARVERPDGLGDGPVTYRAVGRSASGFAYGDLQTIIPPDGGPPPPPSVPLVASTATLVKTDRSRARARLRGLTRFYAFDDFAEVPVGTEINARGRPLDVTTSDPGGGTTTAHVRGGEFVVRQARNGDTTFDLSKRLGCGLRAGGVRAARAKRNGLYANWRKKRRKRRRRIKGQYGQGSAKATRFLVQDRCDGTLIAVQRGTVVVTDFVKKRKLRLKAGERYLARAPSRRRR